MNDQFIKVSIEVWVHRGDVPKMTAAEEEQFRGALARELDEYVPQGSDWLDCLSYALRRAGLDTEPQESEA